MLEIGRYGLHKLVMIVYAGSQDDYAIGSSVLLTKVVEMRVTDALELTMEAGKRHA